MTTVLLTIEESPAKKSAICGRVLYENNLIVDTAKSVEALEKKFRKLLHDFHDLNQKEILFELAYDLTSLFKKYNYQCFRNCCKNKYQCFVDEAICFGRKNAFSGNSSQSRTRNS